MRGASRSLLGTLHALQVVNLFNFRSLVAWGIFPLVTLKAAQKSKVQKYNSKSLDVNREFDLCKKGIDVRLTFAIVKLRKNLHFQVFV